MVQNGYGTRIRVELVIHVHKGISNGAETAAR